jgi:hypothetical protein
MEQKKSGAVQWSELRKIEVGNALGSGARDVAYLHFSSARGALRRAETVNSAFDVAHPNTAIRRRAEILC